MISYSVFPVALSIPFSSQFTQQFAYITEKNQPDTNTSLNWHIHNTELHMHFVDTILTFIYVNLPR